MELWQRFVWTCALLAFARSIAEAQTPFQNGVTWSNSTMSVLPMCDFTSVTSGTAQCPNGVISIVSAHYGRQSNTPCPYSSKTCTSGLDVTSRAMTLCDGRTSCDFVRNSVGNWTALNITRKSVCSKVYYKELRITYTCRSVNPTVTCAGLPTATAPANTTGWPATCSNMAVGGMCVAPCISNFNSTSVRSSGVSSICASDGKWSTTEGQCVQTVTTVNTSPVPVITCPGLPTKDIPPNSSGWPSTCNNLPEENVCMAACVSGYVGNYTSICLDGSWEPVDGSCTTQTAPLVTTCSGLPTFMPPANSVGWPAGCSGFSTGATCSAGCVPGFTGGYSSTCTSGGMWSAANGSCTPVRCNSLPTSAAPANSQDWPATCQGMSPGESCTAACAQGYTGTAYTSGCQSDGSWTPAEGYCAPLLCPAPAADTPAHSTSFPFTCGGAKPGEVCTATCAQGAEGPGYSIMCQEDGSWSPAVGSCDVHCNSLPTSAAPANSQGWPATCQGMSPGESCTAACAQGYTGTAYTSRCQSNGSWTPAEGYCAPLSCVGLPTQSPPPNSLGWTDSTSGTVDSKSEDQDDNVVTALAVAAAAGCSGGEGSVCTSPCKDGYSGSYESTCKAGAWSEIAGSCVAAYCPGLPATEVSGGTAWPTSCSSATIGSKCIQPCQPGYTGGVVAECLANATWSKTVTGSCIQDTCSTVPEWWFTGQAKWPGSCNGTVTNGTCHAGCDEDYSGSGYTMRCIAKDTWGDPSGECKRDTCSTPPPYTNLTNSLGWEGSCVNLTTKGSCLAPCDSSFGAGYTAECIAKDTWGPVEGNCPDACNGAPTEEPPEDSRGWGPNCIANGALVGGRCVAGCAPSFRGRLFSFCVGKNQWSEVNGTCEPVCKMVHRGCETCRAIRIPGMRNSSELVCSKCFAGWRLRRDGEMKTCDCAPGFMLTGPSDDPDSTCVPCEEGRYCPGGTEDDNPESLSYPCPRGLETIIPGAKSEMQCYTQPGFGRTTRLVGNEARVAAFVCPIGAYNTGGNSAGCTKCGQGLTTIRTGSTNSSMCVAPAGSYVDRGMASKVCPRGTYTTDFNNFPNCIVCPDGITTKGENSTSLSQCRLAKIGYYLVNATTAEKCPTGSYQGREAEIYECSECPYGWVTKEEGSEGKASCMAPPGFELKEGADWISECEIGYWKEGWNKNPCVPCGTGLSTAKTGSVSKDDCLIPAGWGIESLEPPVAVMCVNNSYGVNMTRAVVSTSRCVLCAPNLFTSDTLSGVPAAQGYTQETDCVVRPGWGISPSGLVEICPPGTYNEGYNRKRCMECGTGYTSVAAGAEDEDACVVQSGWALDLTLRIPKPCDVGTYSTGGTLDNPAGECQACPAGFTTQKDESDTVDDCEVCVAGRGGVNCTVCPYNTYSTGIQQQGLDCIPCAAGTVSAQGSTHNTHCVPEQVDSDRDYFPLSDESRWTDFSAETSVECQFRCNSNTGCIMFRFSTDASSPKCQLLLEDPAGTQAIALKADASGVGYAVYTVPADLQVGVLVADQGASLTPQECMKLCSAASRCELVSLEAAALPSTPGPCRLFASEFDIDWVGMYHIQGSKLHANMLLEG